MKIRQILQGKKINALFSVTSSTTVYDALVEMADKNIGAVLVIDEGKLSGIFSERDYARKIVLKGRHSDDTPVSDVMTANVITVEMEDKLEMAMQIMSEKHIRHLPVMENAILVGIISINDVVSSIIQEQKSQIASLQGYISGNYA
ncbi:putative signal transduction protein with CBS domains [Emticicia oligotrophica DSM 17448]|uniref:Signal transduction protein with CBS domains n=1 Tax=Emticicia oligotrophica (strain DSM 17448 / CIP 109782 / MTCC 6937 / GPTSA100-15) TaxID=929562 RepID=A0ABM5N2S9_EMTOG|nr:MULTISPECIES: CBS domain-containing protein [Emticicia]AFK03750.1 putative signal transduction protein with CBS domains [Emticicia oligotrophica DSM 17448]